MSIKEYIKAAGVFLVAIGFLCLPIGFGASPKRDLSAFSNLADLGIFIKTGLILLSLGLLFLTIALLIPRRDE